MNSNEELQIRLQPAGDHRENAHAVEAPDAQGSQSHVLHNAQRTRRVGTTGLRPLLRKLLADPHFRESRMPLTLSEGTLTTVAEGCLHSGTATGSEFYRIVWGTIVRARTDILSNGWFDSGRSIKHLPAVCAMGEARPTLCSVAGVESFAELVGWHFIVEAEFRRSGMGNPTAWINEPAQIALVPPTSIHVR
ncbi:hypothetical protein [Sanguibacter sp. HDW7]|uniref:hypothetical protein n=1 Tax=Sanguibacter sp. HDW7 TaxID=2714931 RepID=UPI00140C4133|nr:hypothetical protein [Sanguibacter sp. HDW7]QIK82328.1 hypothetical protein G7063_00885 [Sanguibacter sp. HDW7]